MSQQLLPKLLKCLESASSGINFCPVVLPRGGEGLGNWQEELPTLASTTEALLAWPGRVTMYVLLSRPTHLVSLQQGLSSGDILG